MDCASVVRALGEGKLRPEHLLHLAGCPACRAQQRMIGALATPVIPPGLPPPPRHRRSRCVSAGAGFVLAMSAYEWLHADRSGTTDVLGVLDDADEAVVAAIAPPAVAEPPALDATDAVASDEFSAIADRLALTVGQRNAVADAVYTANAARVDIDAREAKARLALCHLLDADTVDAAAVLDATDALNAAAGDLRRNRVQLVLDLRKILTPDQWRNLVALRNERGQP